MMTKVLVIDDEKIIRDRMTKLLELDDYETFSAENGQKGLEIFYKEKPEVALVDIKMPGMNGIEVLKKIREDAKETQVILITGHGGVETAIQALKEGAFGYVQKPIEYDELEIEIKRALEKQEMQKRLDQYLGRLEIAHAELDQIFNAAADGLLVIDRDFNILRSSESFFTLAGIGKDEAGGKKCYDVFPGPPCHTPDCTLDRILSGMEGVEDEVEKRRFDGTSIHCIVTARPFRGPDGQPRGVVTNFKDVTNRKRTEDALQEAHAELEKVFQQVRRDYEIAQKVFANVVRTDYIEFSNVKYLLSPMNIVGGDLFLTEAGPSGSQYVFLGDFTGHGLSAAIGAIPVSDIFYTMASKGHSIEKIVAETNQKLKNVLPTGLFLCACFIELDYTRGILTVWNGGLPDALIIGRQEGMKRRLPSMHLPLGVVGNDRLDTTVKLVELAQGDRVYVYTDGVIEASNKDGEMFGQERLEEHFAHIQEPEGLFDEISGSLAAFCSGKAQEDDIAMVEIRYDAREVRRFNRKTISEPEEVSTGWRSALVLGPDSLRTNESLPHLMEMLMGAHRGLRDHKENIYLVVSELFSNALDWGVLGLDSKMKKDPEGFEEYYAARERALAALRNGRIKIDLELFEQGKGGKLVLGVEDSGPGFDYSREFPQLSDNITPGGRGIPLLQSLCREVTYMGRGNKVQAVYSWEE
jgi:PAS domain S-box-containing protein